MESFDDLLFKPSSTTPALFVNKSDLAREIASLPESKVQQAPNPYAGKAASLATLLAQVARGERSCPAALQHALWQAIRIRWRQKTRQQMPPDLHDRLLAVTTPQAATPRGKTLPAEHLFRELVALGTESPIQFIITNQPAEDTTTSARAETLRKILIQRFGLYEGAPSIRTYPQYTFCLPATQARHFWRTLFTYITSLQNPCGPPLSATHAARLLAEISRDDYLKVFEVDDYLCACPVVLFTPTRGLPESAFTLFYHGTTGISVAKFDTASLTFWRAAVFVPLRDGDLRSRPIPCPDDLAGLSVPAPTARRRTTR